VKLLAVTLSLITCAALAADKYPGWPKIIRDIPYGEDVTVTIPEFSIRYFIPKNPEIQMAGGSGGPIGRINITNQETKRTASFDFQTVGARILEFKNGYPQFEIWSRAGGGVWCRQLYQFRKGKFQNVQIDEFTQFPLDATDKAVTTTLTRSEDILYYVGTRYPDAE
jgi:hypothetical protein